LNAHKPAFDSGTLRFVGQFDPAHFFWINLIQINASGPKPDNPEQFDSNDPEVVELL
jgi:hypothetical protein